MTEFLPKLGKYMYVGVRQGVTAVQRHVSGMTARGLAGSMASSPLGTCAGQHPSSWIPFVCLISAP